MGSLPKVSLVGGPDIDARLELMHCLKDAFNFTALGSDPTLHDRFATEGFGNSTYHLSRRVDPVPDLPTLGQLVITFRRLKRVLFCWIAN